MVSIRKTFANHNWHTAAGLLVVVAFSAEQAFAQTSNARRRFAQVQMGVEFEITFYAQDEKAANRAAEAAFRRIEQLNAIMSDYDQESELMQLSRTAGGGSSVRVSPDLWTVLTRSIETSHASDGAFDVTVGPVVRLWRRARRQKRLPSAERLREARKAVGYELIRLNERDQSVELLRPAMRLDLGGIAKGYAADAALEVLRQLGITRAMVDAGGDIVVGDPPPESAGWRVGVARPEAPDAALGHYLTLSNCAVATSGDAYQFVEIDGVRYSHIVDPRTGIGLTDRSSVTVIAPDGVTADALASAISVLGPQKGLALLTKYAGAEVMIFRDGEGSIEVTKSCGWSGFAESAVRPATSPL